MLLCPQLFAQRPIDGYRVDRYWEPEAGDPRALMNGPAGRMWVGCGDGSVRILEDKDRDGRAERVRTFVRGTWNPNGLAWRARGDKKGYEVFVCHTTARYGGTGRVTRFIDTDGDDTFDEVVTVIVNLPPGAHQTNNLALGPDGRLYFSQGATSDRGPGGGALVGHVDPDAKDLRWGNAAIKTYATGLRNAWGLAFHPSGALLATDNVSDNLGEKTPPDELNVLLAGRDYGFPRIEGMPPEGHASVAPIGSLGIHAAASGIAVDTGSRMSGFEGQAFVAQWGSWTGSPGEDAGTGLVRVQLHRTSGGSWRFAAHDFVRNCGRPLDVAIGPDGALYFTVQTSAPAWREGVYRVVPSSGVTLRLKGAPVPGGRVGVTVRAPGQQRATARIRGRFGWLSRSATLQIGPDGNATSYFDVPALPALSGTCGDVWAEIIDPRTGAARTRSPRFTISIL